MSSLKLCVLVVQFLTVFHKAETGGDSDVFKSSWSFSNDFALVISENSQVVSSSVFSLQSTNSEEKIESSSERSTSPNISSSIKQSWTPSNHSSKSSSSFSSDFALQISEKSQVSSSSDSSLQSASNGIRLQSSDESSTSPNIINSISPSSSLSNDSVLSSSSQVKIQSSSENSSLSSFSSNASTVNGSLLSKSSNIFSSSSVRLSPSDICSRRYDIFDNKTYIRSSCFMSLNTTWNNAKSTCESNGMFLFRITNTLVEYSITRSAAEIYGQSPLQNIWVNAKKDANGNWISYENTNTTTMSEFARLLWVDKASQSLGDCMAITNRNGPFRVTGYPCTELAPFVCSYINK